VRRSRSIRFAQVIGILAIAVVSLTSTNASTQHGFTFKEYEEFHDVLHPLEHEALPQKDFGRIRSQANELVRLGNAIVKFGVPQISTVPDEMEKELKKFNKALSRFARDAKRGKDSRLQKSYSAVHDSFERLAGLSEEVNRGVPPVVSLFCPELPVTEGKQVALQAGFLDPEQVDFTWTVSAGKIIKTEKQNSIVLDTSGLAGVTIKVTAEVNDRRQHLIATSCEVTVLPRQ
jgi:hypothetical protein